MAAVASTKFTQGPNTAAPGVAVIGTLTVVDGNVVITNGDNTDVESWKISLLEAPPGSALVPGVLDEAATNTPSADFAADVRGCYRCEVLVRNGSGVENIDYRVFAVPELNGVIIPPSQIWPIPLPPPESGLPNAKPNECNFGAQERGWMGDDSYKMLHYVLKNLPTTSLAFGDSGFFSVGATPAATGAFRMGNNMFLKGRNFANSSDVQLIGVDASNLIRLGAGGIYMAFLSPVIASRAASATPAWTGDFAPPAYATAISTAHGASSYIESDALLTSFTHTYSVEWNVRDTVTDQRYHYAATLKVVKDGASVVTLDVESVTMQFPNYPDLQVVNTVVGGLLRSTLMNSVGNSVLSGAAIHVSRLLLS